jgi:hypothetical protein
MWKIFLKIGFIELAGRSNTLLKFILNIFFLAGHLANKFLKKFPGNDYHEDNKGGDLPGARRSTH